MSKTHTGFGNWHKMITQRELLLSFRHQWKHTQSGVGCALIGQLCTSYHVHAMQLMKKAPKQELNMEPLTLITFTQWCSHGKTGGMEEEGKHRRDQQPFWSGGQRSRRTTKHIQPLGNGNGSQVASSAVGSPRFPPPAMRRRGATSSSPIVPPGCRSQTCPGSGDILLNACHSATKICWPLLWHQQTRHTHARTQLLAEYLLLHQIFMPQRQKVMKKRIFSWFVCLSPTQHLFFYAVIRCTTENRFIVLHVY